MDPDQDEFTHWFVQVYSQMLTKKVDDKFHFWPRPIIAARILMLSNEFALF